MQKIPAIIIFVLMLTLPLTGFAGQKDYLTPAFWTSATVADVNTAFKNSADLKATNQEGRTVLMLAASYSQNPEVMLRLLKYGGNVKIKGDLGQTALELAAENRHIRGTAAFGKLKAAMNK